MIRFITLYTSEGETKSEIRRGKGGEGAYSEKDDTVHHHYTTPLYLAPSTRGGPRINLQNFQNLSKTLLCTPNLVIIISALLAITNKIGHIASVSNATKMTGAREVRAEAALGLLERNVWRGFMKPAMFVRDARAHKRETGNI